MNDSDRPSSSPAPRRVIKRYSNRKLYDTKDSSYVTLLQIAEMIRAGEDVQVIDNATKDDKTDVTLALIISEELKSRPHAIPLSTLKALIRHRGERILSHLRDGPIGKLMPRENQENHEAADGAAVTEDNDVSDASRDSQTKGLRATLEQWQQTVDERIRAALPNFTALRELQQQVERLSARVEQLEQRLTGGESKPPGGSGETPGG
jgi:polyhydroxyalkanoate synthesis repressor PhaR